MAEESGWDSLPKQMRPVLLAANCQRSVGCHRNRLQQPKHSRTQQGRTRQRQLTGTPGIQVHRAPAEHARWPAAAAPGAASGVRGSPTQPGLLLGRALQGAAPLPRMCCRRCSCSRVERRCPGRQLSVGLAASCRILPPTLHHLVGLPCRPARAAACRFGGSEGRRVGAPAPRAQRRLEGGCRAAVHHHMICMH